WQDSAYFSLAQIACGKGAYGEALDLIGRSLDRNARNYRARHLKAALHRKAGRPVEAAAFAAETLKLDVADFGAANECYLAVAEQGNDTGASETLAALMRLMRGDAHNYLNLADDYAGAGLYEEAIDVLGRIADGVNTGIYPMLHYTLGYLYERTDRAGEAAACRLAGQQATPDYCFPNSLFDLVVLESAIRANPLDAQARYFLGNLLYDKKRFEEAIEHWEESRNIYAGFATVHRNLALAYFNKRDEPEAAKQSLECAFSLNKNDARVFYELDQLYKKLGYSPAKRFEILEAHISLVGKRDDLYLEYVTLLNTLGRNEEATAALTTRIFHPWEGGEGKATGQYVLAHVELAKRRLNDGLLQEALTLLQQALVYPPNLGEGKLAGAQENNIYYHLGCVHEALGEQTEAAHCFLTASRGLEEPASAMYYNDQPPDMIFYQGMAWLKLGSDQEAKRRFNKLVDFAEKHLFDHVKIDYFAVSLPDFLVFEDNLDKRNEVHCRYMRGLGLIGLGQTVQAEAELDEVIRLDSNHQGARIHKRLY
ncbi:MAG: hypothetical protein JWN30_2042, partial [Bacilli bacterium]|nr:hypothetical protein [Bacilli bacterium]